MALIVLMIVEVEASIRKNWIIASLGGTFSLMAV